MGNKEESFVPYFKIRWAKKPNWTLEQAAYLSYSKDPDAKNYEIALEATNPVNKRYQWLLTKRLKGHLKPVGSKDGIEHFKIGSLLRPLEERFKSDKELRKVVDHMDQAPFGIDHTKLVSRAVYRQAGRLIFAQFPLATKEDVAKVLANLPPFFNSEDHGHIETLEPGQISNYVQGLGDLSGKPKVADKVEVSIDLAQLVEKL